MQRFRRGVEVVQSCKSKALFAKCRCISVCAEVQRCRGGCIYGCAEVLRFSSRSGAEQVVEKLSRACSEHVQRCRCSEVIQSR